MADEPQPPSKGRKVLKWVLGIVGTLVLGALGTPVWERVLSPLLSLGVRLAAGTSHSFKNAIYAQAAEGFHESAAVGVLIFTLMLSTGVYIFPLMAGRKAVLHLRRLEMAKAGVVLQEKPAPTLKATERSLKWTMFLAAAGLLMLVFSMARMIFANSITTYSFNSIEILSPMIGDKERLKLRSQFLQVRTAEDFQVFYGELQHLANVNSITLPDFSPL